MMAGTLEAFGEAVAKTTGLGRIGNASDIGGTALYLASKAGAFTTGAQIVLDGGMLAKAVPLKAHL